VKGAIAASNVLAVVPGFTAPTASLSTGVPIAASRTSRVPAVAAVRFAAGSSVAVRSPAEYVTVPATGIDYLGQVLADHEATVSGPIAYRDLRGAEGEPF